MPSTRTKSKAAPAPAPARKAARTPAAATKKAPAARKAGGAAAKAPAGSMREQVMAFKREQILNEAVELFYELGYPRTSLDMVAQRLGVTKPFIYYHFRDKAEILMEVSKRGISRGNDVLKQALQALQAGGTAAQRLEAAVRDISGTILQVQRYTAIFFREQKNFEEETRAPLAAMHREFDDLLARLLEEGVRRGEFRIRDIRLCSLAIGGMLNWAYTWYREGGRLSPAEIADGMAEMVMQMVLVPQAHGGKR